MEFSLYTKIQLTCGYERLSPSSLTLTRRVSDPSNANVRSNEFFPLAAPDEASLPSWVWKIKTKSWVRRK